MDTPKIEKPRLYKIKILIESSNGDAPRQWIDLELDSSKVEFSEFRLKDAFQEVQRRCLGGS